MRRRRRLPLEARHHVGLVQRRAGVVARDQQLRAFGRPQQIDRADAQRFVGGHGLQEQPQAFGHGLRAGVVEQIARVLQCAVEPCRRGAGRVTLGEGERQIELGHLVGQRRGAHAQAG